MLADLFQIGKYIIILKTKTLYIYSKYMYVQKINKILCWMLFL